MTQPAVAVEASNVLAFEGAKQSGCRVLIVEDEMLIALALVDVVSALDASSVVASRAAKALALVASEPFDAAIIDMSLAGEPADGILDALSARYIPFIITTGYSAQAIAEKYRSLPMLHKPYMPEEVEAALRLVLAPAEHRARSVLGERAEPVFERRVASFAYPPPRALSRQRIGNNE